MAENEEQTSSQPSNSKPSSSARHPTITLPPRTSFEALLNGGVSAGAGFGVPGFSPGPMTLVSSLFSDAADEDDCKSFSQLLAGAITSPPAARPAAADFWLPSPGFLSPGQGPFGMTHQQVLAQVTAQAMQANSNSNSNSNAQTEIDHFTPLPASPGASLTQLRAFSPDSASQQEMPSFEPLSAADASRHWPPVNSDKPSDDGFNWRKYGQKQVKGSKFPRSYYKCTVADCPVKKQVERSLDGQVTEIIYKGQHNHQPPRAKKSAKNSNSSAKNRVNHDLASQFRSGGFGESRDEPESSRATHEEISGSIDSEDMGEGEEEQGGEDEPEPKRRNVESASSQRSVTEPKIIVQTTSEVDLLDDGYRWRKYGQKVVKANPYPRSYYKCTTPGCNVRKHVERASTDPKAVITTYEGKHTHDVPAAKNRSHSTANNYSASNNKMDLRNKTQQPIGRLRWKEEEVTE